MPPVNSNACAWIAALHTHVHVCCVLQTYQGDTCCMGGLRPTGNAGALGGDSGLRHDGCIEAAGQLPDPARALLSVHDFIHQQCGDTTAMPYLPDQCTAAAALVTQCTLCGSQSFISALLHQCNTAHGGFGYGEGVAM